MLLDHGAALRREDGQAYALAGGTIRRQRGDRRVIQTHHVQGVRRRLQLDAVFVVLHLRLHNIGIGAELLRGQCLLPLKIPERERGQRLVLAVRADRESEFGTFDLKEHVALLDLLPQVDIDHADRAGDARRHMRQGRRVERDLAVHRQERLRDALLHRLEREKPLGVLRRTNQRGIDFHEPEFVAALFAGVVQDVVLAFDREEFVRRLRRRGVPVAVIVAVAVILREQRGDRHQS